jgi:hypothetical protein
MTDQINFWKRLWTVTWTQLCVVVVAVVATQVVVAATQAEVHLIQVEVRHTQVAVAHTLAEAHRTRAEARHIQVTRVVEAVMELRAAMEVANMEEVKVNPVVTATHNHIAHQPLKVNMVEAVVRMENK